MTDKLIKTPTPGGERVPLAPALPLATPYLIQIFPSYACNFHCAYCLHGLPPEKHGYLSDVKYMDLAFYRKCLDDIKMFPGRLKMLRFAGVGEPLLHKSLPEMVRYAVEAEVAESVDIVTNGALITPKLSLALIEAGLGRLRISINGLSQADYQANCRASVDFNRLVENITYFYKNSGLCRVYIKIIDYMVQEPDRERLFFNIFGPICHDLAIEHLTPTIAEINYQTLSGGMELALTQNGRPLLEAQICPQGFYMMQINPDGKIVPCCSMKYPAVLGDAKEKVIPSIWAGEVFNNFRLALLNQEKSAVCRECLLYKYDLHVEDLLDQDTERLKNAY